MMTFPLLLTGPEPLAKGGLESEGKDNFSTSRLGYMQSFVIGQSLDEVLPIATVHKPPNVRWAYVLVLSQTTLKRDISSSFKSVNSIRGYTTPTGI
jgi:hypothetical protein